MVAGTSAAPEPCRWSPARAASLAQQAGRETLAAL